MQIPQNFEQWRTCIEVHCRVPLTREYVAQRLRELEDRSVYSTEQLLRRYGEAHVERIRGWFCQAAQELNARG